MSEPEPVHYASPVGSASLHWRAAGDYAVYRFSGKLRGGAESIVEHVAALEGDLAIVDLTIGEKNRLRTMRLYVGNAPGWDQVVFAAAWVTRTGALQPVPVAAYETLLAHTLFAADQNDGLFSSEAMSVQIGERRLGCQKDNYLVKLGKRQAFLSLTHATDVLSTELSGELRAMDGTLLYRAELVDLGNDRAAVSRPLVATLD